MNQCQCQHQHRTANPSEWTESKAINEVLTDSAPEGSGCIATDMRGHATQIPLANHRHIGQPQQVRINEIPVLLKKFRVFDANGHFLSKDRGVRSECRNQRS